MTEYSRDSSFNMGVAHLTRIDALLYDIAYYSSEEDYNNWHKTLGMLCREVFFLFSLTEMEQSANLDNNCVESINKFYKEKDIISKTKAYNSLIQYELFIKQQLATRKMLMAFSRDLKTSISDLT